jgi:YHS domain-containing protein
VWRLSRSATPASLGAMTKQIVSAAFAFALVLPLAACEKKAETAPRPTAAATTAPAAVAGATVGDDAKVPKLAVGASAKCPVTNEEFTVKEGTVQVTYAGKRYAFCCPECQPTFTKNPTKYAKN